MPGRSPDRLPQGRGKGSAGKKPEAASNAKSVATASLRKKCHDQLRSKAPAAPVLKEANVKRESTLTPRMVPSTTCHVMTSRSTTPVSWHPTNDSELAETTVRKRRRLLQLSLRAGKETRASSTPWLIKLPTFGGAWHFPAPSAKNGKMLSQGHVQLNRAFL